MFNANLEMNNYRKYFILTVRNNFPHNAAEIISGTDDQYKNILPDVLFSKTSENPIDKRLDFCAYFLALIKTLDEKGETFDRIRKISLEVVTEYVRPKNKVRQLFKRLPAKVAGTWLAEIVIKSLNKRVNHNSNPGRIYCKPDN